MVYDARVTGVYPGRPDYYLELYVRRESTDVANRRSTYYWALIAHRGPGANPPYNFNLNPGGWGVTVGAQSWYGNAVLDFRSTNQNVLQTGYTNWMTHGPSGELAFYFSAYHGPIGQFGQANTPVGTFVADPIATVPPAPSPIGLDQITTTSMRYRFQSNGTGGSPVTSWAFQYATNPSFTGAVLVGSSGTSTVTLLNPATTYYFRSRGQNAVGVGPWSSVISATTLPASPPGLSIAPNLAGTSATLTFTPPGVGTVTSYQWQRRLLGTTAPVTSGSSTATTTTVGSLTPGAFYEWRARAMYGSASSPWTAWTTQAQPNPNTAPGDYFDGSTADTDDVSYTWNGTANNSASTATGVSPEGWSSWSGAGFVQRVTGGRTGSYSARITLTQDSPAFLAGMQPVSPYLSDVEPNSTYFGSMFFRAVEDVEVAIDIAWFNSSGILLSTGSGSPVELAADPDTWVRVVTSAQSPPDAALAGVVARIVDGTAGATVFADNMMLTLSTQLPYFDGDTPSTSAFFYNWDGDPNESISYRLTLPGDEDDPLEDPDCDPVPLPPRPPAVPDACIEEVSQWRRYWSALSSTDITDWSTMVPTFILTTGALPARQVRIRIWANPDNLPVEQLGLDDWFSEMIVSYIPANTVFTIDGASRRAWAEVNGAESRPADHLLYGTGGTPASWPELGCGISYAVAFDVPLDAPEGNLQPVIELRERN